MVSLDQSITLAAMLADGWRTVPSKRPLEQHRMGEPVLVTRAEKFKLITPNGATVEPTPEQIAEW